MPKNQTIISVFVASPTDVLEEREALESITQELNKIWSNQLNLRLELIKWETDIYPGFGNSPQDVINNQVNDEYDVFIAIFWSEVGTPTAMADSGTIEEFGRAYNKYKKNPNSIDLMVYFKDQALPPSKMDPEQLQKIQKLKEKLGEQGGLYSTFTSLEDFTSSLRIHLSQIAQKWSAKLSKSGAQEVSLESETGPNIGSIEKEDVIEDDDGLLDFIEIYEDRIKNMTEALTSMADATAKIGDQFNKRTEEINSLINENGQTNNRQARKIINSASDDMDQYSKIMESQIKIASKSREEGFSALSKAIPLQVEFMERNSADDLNDMKEGLETMIGAMSGTKESLSGFLTIISDFPRLTASLNKSKRRAVKVLNEVLDELGTAELTANDVLRIISELTNGENKSN